MNAQVKITNRAGASFPVRRMSFDFDQVPEYWMNGSAGLTHFMTALSALFPAGEKFFIDSVRAVRQHPAIKDNEALQKKFLPLLVRKPCIPRNMLALMPQRNTMAMTLIR